MADHNPKLLQLTVPEIQALGERLYARGISKLATDTPEQARDLRIAARLIWTLCVEIGVGRIVRVEGA
jgi:hypothetical protein